MGKYTCPWCGRRFPYQKVNFRCNSCRNDISNKPIYSREGYPFIIKHFMPEAVECTHCHQITNFRLCPNCKGEIGAQILVPTKDVISIAVVGGYRVGKSNYVGTLIEQLRKNTLKNIINGTVNLASQNMQMIYDKWYYNPLYEIHSSVSGKWEEKDEAVDEQMDHEDREGKIMMLDCTLTYGEKKLRTMHIRLYDIDMQTLASNSSNLKMLELVDGVIALLDPIQLDYVWSRIDERKKEVSCPEVTLSLRKQQGSVMELLAKQMQGLGKSSVPVAVTLSKIDALGELLISGGHLAEENSVISEKGYDEKLAAGISEEVKSLLYSWGEKGLVDEWGKRFSKLAYFGVSALGHIPYPSASFQPSPSRVEEPLLWLLKQKKSII